MVQRLDKAQGMFDSHAKAQQEAIGRGDFDAAGTMADQMQSGEFGHTSAIQRLGDSTRLGRAINPFTGNTAVERLFAPGLSQSGKSYADRARGFQAGDPAKIEKLQTNLKRFGPQMSPEQRASMQQQIEALNKHKAVQIPFGAPPAPPTGGGNFPKPQSSPGGIQYGAAHPYDYRQHMYEAALQQGGQSGY